MNDVSQIRIGRNLTGIIGLKSTLAEVAAGCRGMSDEHVGKILLKRLAKQNYIETGLFDMYEQAFLREYKRFIGEPVTETSSQGLEIKVLGQGCPQCDRMEQEIMAVIAETGITAALEHVRDAAEIGRLGVMGVPAMMINGKVVCVGSVPSRAKIKALIDQASK